MNLNEKKKMADVLIDANELISHLRRELEENLKAKNKEITELKKKYSDLSEFNLQIKINTLNDLKKSFTFNSHFIKSIQPEELDSYIEKLTEK